jgi:hypothetical protein
MAEKTIKRTSAGLGIQSLGRHYDESELGKKPVYCISVNTAATAASTRGQKPDFSRSGRS